MSMSVRPERSWRKASACTGTAACVEVALSVEHVAMRDGKDPDGPVLRFDADAWAGFTAAVRTGGFARTLAE